MYMIIILWRKQWIHCLSKEYMYIYRRNICIKNNYLCLSKKYESTNEYDCKNIWVNQWIPL